MKIAVTGAAGRVSRRLAETHAESDGNSYVWTDALPNPGTVSPWIQSPLTHLSALIEAFDEVDIVVHLGAVTQPPPAAEHLDLVSGNVLGTATVLEAAVKAGVHRLVMASSICATGLLWSPLPWIPRYVPVDESHPAYPLDYYGVSKLSAEQFAIARAYDSGLEIVALRLCSVYFPYLEGQVDLAQHRAMDEDVAGRVRLWSYVHVDDVVEVIHACITADRLPQAVVCNVAALDTVATSHTTDLIQRHLPGVPMVRKLEMHESLIATDRVRELLGVQLGRTWRSDTQTSRYAG